METQVTKQEMAWAGEVGRRYTDRNILTATELDQLYLECFGTTRWSLNERFLFGVPYDAQILEVGCNIGMQLRHLQQEGYRNLRGIELQQYAIDNKVVDVPIDLGSAEKLPYEDNSFDLVYTSGVLIHLPESTLAVNNTLYRAVQEIARVSRKWIWGFEYFASPREEIRDRNWQDMLWADDYPTYFLWWIGNGLHLVRRWSEPYHGHLSGTVADMYLLEKTI